MREGVGVVAVPLSIKHLGVDLQIHIIEVPLPLAKALYQDNPLFPEFGGEQRPEPVPSVSHGLVANADLALSQQVRCDPQTEWKPNIHHLHQPDDLGRRVEILERACWACADSRPARTPLTMR